MAQTMTASIETMTDGQIDTAVDQLRAALRKHRSEFPRDAAQQALGVDNLGMRMMAPFKQAVEAVTGMIARAVKVDRTRSNREAIAATGRKQYVDNNVLDGMPPGEGDEATVYYFKPDKSVYDRHGLISPDKVAHEYEIRGLKPDPRAVAADNEANPAFADETPNACQWRDADGNLCYVAFGRWLGGRGVGVDRVGGDWGGRWSFGGVRK